MAEPNVFRSSVEREVMWAPWEGPGLEHLRLVTSGSGIVANGLVIGLEAGRPFRIGYEIRCDGRWRVQEVRAAAPDLGQPVLELLTDGEGHWKRGGGEPMPELDGCIDVDIYPSPLTNSLPIRRLGAGAETTAAWVQIPELTVEPLHQRYTRLEGGNRWRYEALSSGFTTEFEVDADGLLLDYPGLACRWRPHGAQ